MKKIKNKSKLYMIISIIILVVVVIGSAYAYYRIVLFSDLTVNPITKGLDYYINYAKGTDITSSVLEPSSDYRGGNSVTITFYKKDNTYDIYGHIYLDVTSVGTTLSSSASLKYTVLSNNIIISQGTLGSIANGDSLLLAVNIPLSTEQTEYTVYLWLDDANSNASSVENETISATVRCEATMKEINSIPYDLISTKIINMFTPNTTVINNNVPYEYDTTHNLMKDVGGNIRYYGASPNNYIYFNCSDYSNQSSSTCETWRIIGVFEGKVKIMRNSIITRNIIMEKYSWDNKNTDTGAEDNYGKNDWTDARLMKLLNPGYKSETTGGSLYYNSGSGSCYSGQSNATTTCDFTSTGIKNDTTRNLISDTLYYLGGWNTSEIYSDQIYGYERGTTVYSGRPTTWTGKIALPYPSDYGYAADLGSCTQNLLYYDDSTCTSTNWMKPILGTNSCGWLLTPNSGSSRYAWSVNPFGNVYDDYTYDSYGVAPVLYLSSELGIGSGTGTNSDPYRLSVS